MRIIYFLLSWFIFYSFQIEEKGEKKIVKVSYYHDKFNGRRTANGAVFSNKKMTASHKTLPFGTKVRFTNPKNQKSVIVEINDRGPYSKGLVFDLSKSAFMEIGDIRSGILAVEYEIITE